MSTVREEISGDTIANQVRLEGQTHPGSFLLIEGSQDYRLFLNFVDGDCCSLIVCCGRENLLGAMTGLCDQGFDRAVGFADKDYADLVGYPDFRGTIAFTDENDLEVMIICSDALISVLAEFADPGRVAAAVGAEGKPVCEVIFDSAALLGALRLLSKRSGWNLRFDGMTYRFATANSDQCDLARTITHVVGRSDARPEEAEADIRDMMVAITEEQVAKKAICNGHDCVRYLARALKSRLGSTNKFDNDNGVEILGGILRVAYQLDHFMGSQAYEVLREWERASGYPIFREAA